MAEMFFLLSTPLVTPQIYSVETLVWGLPLEAARMPKNQYRSIEYDIAKGKLEISDVSTTVSYLPVV